MVTYTRKLLEKTQGMGLSQTLRETSTAIEVGVKAAQLQRWEGACTGSVKVEGKSQGHSFGVISKESAGGTLPLPHPQHLYMETKFSEFFIYMKSQNVQSS